ncbi:MAG: hypothetical protein ACYS0G_03555 [Planctomycetota bacterium]|jgi:hypothetical protein
MFRPTPSCFVRTAKAAVILMSLQLAAAAAAKPVQTDLPAGDLDRAVGPWPVEQLLLPYPLEAVPGLTQAQAAYDVPAPVAREVHASHPLAAQLEPGTRVAFFAGPRPVEPSGTTTTASGAADMTSLLERVERLSARVDEMSRQLDRLFEKVEALEARLATKAAGETALAHPRAAPTPIIGGSPSERGPLSFLANAAAAPGRWLGGLRRESLQSVAIAFLAALTLTLASTAFACVGAGIASHKAGQQAGGNLPAGQ